jgi:hypothetical protein
MISFAKLWENHPYPIKPCDSKLFVNQCAIRMGVALELTGVSFKSFTGATCSNSFRLKHTQTHVLRAEELANWLKKGAVAGVPKIFKKKITSHDLIGQNGIIFIKDGWPSGGDHIDVWNGTACALKGGAVDYLALGKQVWFWEIKS